MRGSAIPRFGSPAATTGSGAGTGGPEPKKGKVHEHTASGPLGPQVDTHPAKEMGQGLTTVKQRKNLVGMQDQSKQGQ